MKRPAARKSLLSVNSMMKPLAFFLTGADGGELVRNQVAVMEEAMEQMIDDVVSEPSIPSALRTAADKINQTELLF